MENTTTHTIDGHTFVLRSFITGRQAMEITSVDSEQPKLKEAMLVKKMIEVVVISVDGKTEGVVDTVLDMPMAIFSEIVSEVSSVVEGKKKEASTETTS
jgi:hypothetical protein